MAVALNIAASVNLEQLRAYKRKLHYGVPRAQQRVAGWTANEMRQRVAVRTGALRDSIRVVQDGDDWAIRIGMVYWVFVEFGTRYMAAQPFVYTALEAAKARLGQFAREEIEKA